MENKHFAFGKINYLLLVVSVVIIILGFILISGGKSTEETGFDPSIFNVRRIVVAPVITVVGFILAAFAIIKKSKK